MYWVYMLYVHIYTGNKGYVFFIFSAGFCILIGYGVHLLMTTFPHRKHVVLFLFLFCLVVMTTKTITQNQVWRSRKSLFQ